MNELLIFVANMIRADMAWYMTDSYINFWDVADDRTIALSQGITGDSHNPDCYRVTDTDEFEEAA